MATLTTQLWCCRADVYPVCLDDKQMSEESTSCFLSPSALHLPFCAEQHVYFWHPTFATTTKFLLWTKINKTKSTSAPEHFGQRVHCPPRLLEFNSFITALSFIGPNGRLLWSSLLSHLSSPQWAEAFPGPTSLSSTPWTRRLRLISDQLQWASSSSLNAPSPS